MKGFITMSMVVTIVIIILVAAAMFAYWKTVMLLIVTFVVFLIFASIGAEAGPSSNSMFYSFFDAIMRSLP